MTGRRGRQRFGPWHPADILLLFVPVAVLLEIAHAAPILVFAVSALAIVPLAGVMGRMTERLSEKAGPGIGGLLNATFGNAAELIIAVIGLTRGLGEVVKASITGSIIGNSLLVLGLAFLAGGLKRPVQRFNKTAASMGSTLMALAAIGMLVPSLFWYAAGGSAEAMRVAGGPTGDGGVGGAVVTRLERGLSLEIAIVLGAVYLLSLLFSLFTHRHLYAGDAAPAAEQSARPTSAARGPGGKPSSSLAVPIGLLVGSSALVAVLAEFLVGALEPTARALGLTDLFVGVIVVAIVGNAAEHSSAVLAAVNDHVDLALHITIGSSLQIALFVTPLLLGISYFVGPAPLDLHFTLFEVAAVVLAVLAVNFVCQDGESNWLEGALLLAVYAILGIAFFFLPA